MRQLKFHERKLLKKVDFLQWKQGDNLRELQVREMGGGGRRARRGGAVLARASRGAHAVQAYGHPWRGERARRRPRAAPPPPAAAASADAQSRLPTPPFPPLSSQVMRRYHIQGRDDYAAYNATAGLATKLSALLAKLPPTDATRLDLTDELLTRLHDAGVIPVKKSLSSVASLSSASFARRRLAVVMVRLRMAETVKEAATFIEQGHVRVGPATVVDPAFHVSRAAEDFVTWVSASKLKRKVAKYNDALDDYDLLAGA